jgi:hypothetical protein
MEINSYITGFVDGEGCFSVSFNFREKLNVKVEVKLGFSVSQSQRSLNVLQIMKDHFSCGGIRFSKQDNTYKYEVRNLKDLNDKIIPHFLRYSLMTNKKNDFDNFRQVCLMMKQNFHHSPVKIKEILEVAFKSNLSGTGKYQKEDLLKLISR